MVNGANINLYMNILLNINIIVKYNLIAIIVEVI